MSVLDNIVADAMPQQEQQNQTQQPAPQQNNNQQTQPQQFQPPQTNNNQNTNVVQPQQQTNQVTFPQQNAQNNTDNNSLQDFISELHSGDNSADNSAFEQAQAMQQTQNQQQQQTQPQQNQQQSIQETDQADLLVTNILSSNQQQDNYLDGLNMDEIMPRMAEGDTTAFTESLNKVGENATKAALKHFVKMLPDISKNILNQAGKANNEQMQHAQEWNNFIGKHPSFGPFKQMMQKDLIKAVKLTQGNRETAYNNLAAMYSGFVSQNGTQNQQNNNQQQTNGNDEEFDLLNFLSQ